MKEINEKLVRFIGKACIEEDLGELGDDVILIINGNILKVEHIDNCDETQDKIFKIKLITVNKIIKEK